MPASTKPSPAVLRRVVRLLAWLRDNQHHFASKRAERLVSKTPFVTTFERFYIAGHHASTTIARSTWEAAHPYTTCSGVPDNRMWLPNAAGRRLLRQHAS